MLSRFCFLDSAFSILLSRFCVRGVWLTGTAYLQLSGARRQQQRGAGNKVVGCGSSGIDVYSGDVQSLRRGNSSVTGNFITATNRVQRTCKNDITLLNFASRNRSLALLCADPDLLLRRARDTLHGRGDSHRKQQYCVYPALCHSWRRK